MGPPVICAQSLAMTHTDWSMAAPDMEYVFPNNVPGSAQNCTPSTSRFSQTLTARRGSSRRVKVQAQVQAYAPDLNLSLNLNGCW
jgi:hypothetical protein